MDLFKFASRKKQGGQSRYGRMRNMCLAGLLLLSFFAVYKFPGMYERGLALSDWLLIIFTLLSAWVLFYTERYYSSLNGHRPHDWNTAGGSLNAFSFANFRCKKCGRRRILGFQGTDGRLAFPPPGMAAAEGRQARFYCPECQDAVSAEDCQRRELELSRISAVRFAELDIDIKQLKSYRFSSSYTRRYLLIFLLMLMATCSCLYFARSQAVRLLLPLAVGYFMYVSAYNLLSATAARYYVTGQGVLSRSLWGYSLYPLSGAHALVEYDNDSLGFITDRENLVISPIISGYRDMAEELRQQCRRGNVPVIPSR